MPILTTFTIIEFQNIGLMNQPQLQASNTFWHSCILSSVFPVKFVKFWYLLHFSGKLFSFFTFCKSWFFFISFRFDFYLDIIMQCNAMQKKNQIFEFHEPTFRGAGSWKNEKEKRFWKIMNKHNKKWEYLWARSFKSGNNLLIAHFLLALFIFWQKYFFLFT